MGQQSQVTLVCVAPGLAFLLDVFCPNEVSDSSFANVGDVQVSPNWEGPAPTLGGRVWVQADLLRLDGTSEEGAEGTPRPCIGAGTATVRTHGPAEKVPLQGFQLRVRQ